MKPINFKKIKKIRNIKNFILGVGVLLGVFRMLILRMHGRQKQNSTELYTSNWPGVARTFELEKPDSLES